MKKTLRIEIEDNGHWGVTDVEAFESVQVSNLKELLGRANGTIATLETDLRIAMTRYQEAEKDAGDKASLRSTLNAANNVIAERGARIAELEAQAWRDKESLFDSRELVRKLTEELRELRATTTTPSEQIAELEFELKEATDWIAGLRVELDTKERERRLLSQELHASRNLVEELKRSLGAQSAKVNELEGELESTLRDAANNTFTDLEIQRDEARKVAATLANAFRHVSASGLCLILTLEQLQAKAKADEWR